MESLSEEKISLHPDIVDDEGVNDNVDTLDVGGGVGVVQKSLSLLQTRIRMLSRLLSRLCKIGVGGGVL